MTKKQSNPGPPDERPEVPRLSRPTLPPAGKPVGFGTFKKALTELINIHGLDSALVTPDYILANHLVNSLLSIQKTIVERDCWLGANQGIGLMNEGAGDI